MTVLPARIPKLSLPFQLRWRPLSHFTHTTPAPALPHSLSRPIPFLDPAFFVRSFFARRAADLLRPPLTCIQPLPVSRYLAHVKLTNPDSTLLVIYTA